jgi:hypothetical protein
MAMLSQWPSSNSRPLSRHQLLKTIPHRDSRVILKIDHLPQDHNNVAVRLSSLVSPSTPHRRHSASSWMRRGDRRPGLPVYQSVTSAPCPPLAPQGTDPARFTECDHYDTLSRESDSTPAAPLHNRQLTTLALAVGERKNSAETRANVRLAAQPRSRLRQ